MIKSLYSIFAFFFLEYFINCQNSCETSCLKTDQNCLASNSYVTCDPTCRPNYLDPGNNGCTNCPTVSSTNKYYYFSGSGCTTYNSPNSWSKSYKIVYSSEPTQLVKACGENLFEMAGFCYFDCIGGNRMLDEAPYKKCKCRYLYYTQTYLGRTRYVCLNQGDYCGTGYKSYDHDTHLCRTKDCASGKKKKTISITQTRKINRCSFSCLEKEFLNGNYCVDQCPKKYYKIENNTKICVNDCISQNLYISSDYLCVNITQCKYISEKGECLSVCSKKIYNINNINYCVDNCFKNKTYTDYYGNTICVKYCPSKFIQNSNTNLCEFNVDKCYYTGKASSNNKICLPNCSGTRPFHNDGSFNCIAGCTNSNFRYHKEDDFTCYNSCDVIPGLGDKYYNDSFTCRCLFYDNVNKICYNSELDCANNNLNYLEGNKCKNTYCSVDKPYKVKFILNGKEFYKCYDKNECIKNNYYYYNKVDNVGECWVSCLDNKYPNENGTNYRPKEDDNGNTCNIDCPTKFPKLSKGVCKSKCPQNEYFTISLPNKCIDSCASTDFISEDNQCLTNCNSPNYTFTINGKKMCVPNCAKYGKYYSEINTDRNCYNDCNIGSTNYNYYDNKCVSICPAAKPYLYNRICRDSPIQGKFYYSDKVIIDKCNPLLFSKTDPNECLYSCNSNEKIYENHCYTDCPFEAPYFKDENGIKTCVTECNSLILEYSNQCVTESECNSRNYVIDGKKCFLKCASKFLSPEKGCVSACSGNFPYFEKVTVQGTIINICKSSCDGNKKYIHDNECAENCGFTNKNYIGLDNICKNACDKSKNENHYYSFGKFNGIDTFKCSKTCPDNTYIYYKSNDVQCYDKCPDNTHLLVAEKNNNNFECVNKCPSNYPYYYEKYKNGKYIPCTNIFECEYYVLNGKCDENCDQSFVENHFCVADCSSEFGFIKEIPKKNTKNVNLYECRKFCESNEYISEKTINGKNYNECVPKCPYNNNFIRNNKECKSSCTTQDGPYFYPLSIESDYKIFKCTKTCYNSSYPLSLESSTNHTCFDNCPTEYKYLSKNENKCYSVCNSPIYKYTLDINGKEECLFECNSTTTHPYFYSGENICLTNCKSGHFAVEFTNECTNKKCKTMNYYAYEPEGNSDKYKINTCVAQCPSNKPYALDKNGVDVYCEKACTGTNKFFIREFKHYENNIQKKCIPNCPDEYPYHTIYKESGYDRYACQSTCDDGYILHKDGKLCVPSCPTNLDIYKEKYTDIGDFKYILIIKPNEKYCYRDKDKHNGKELYHKEESGSYLLEKCPDDAPINNPHDADKKYFCKTITEINCNYIDYDKNECLKNGKVCSEYGKYRSKIKNKDKNICTAKCNSTYGIYETTYGYCVNDCVNDELVKNGYYLINDNQNKKCVCNSLYYIVSGQIKCFENKKKNKKCKFLSNVYNVTMDGSNECIKSSDCGQTKGKLLSPSKDVCYTNNNCENIDAKFINENTNNCKCKYKYYKRADIGECEYSGCNPNNLDLKIIICLDENGACPKGYEKYIPSTGECVNTCSKEYLSFRNFCLTSNECKNGGFKDKTCECDKGFWYIDNNILHCVSFEDCKNSGYPVYAPDVSESECLKSCKGTYYPYYYNGKCYSSCANSDLLEIKNGFEIFESPKDSNLANYICDCLNPWYYYDEVKKIKNCSESIYPDSIEDCNNFTYSEPKFKYLVKHTLECRSDNCPDDFPFHFNKECFKNCTNDASSYYHYVKEKDDGSKECECTNLWFINSINKSECIEIDINECIKFNFSLKYKINETRQCVSECPSNTKSFNYVCYNECPENTTENTTDQKSCKCDTRKGYWYRYTKDNGTDYLKCALDDCPKENDENNITHVRKNLVEEKGQCLISCSEDDTFKYALRYICREDCPYFMDINNEKDECVFLDLNNEINITNLTLLKDAAGVQAKELYEGSQHLGGYLFNRFNASLHIYAVDINNSLTSISFKSNLTYVDFSTCIKKIFDNNENYLNENLTILIAKYDLLTDTINDYSNSKTSEKDKYLINKVEYELFSSNMSEKLEIDETTCDPYELIISYPLTLNRFNDYEGGLNKNEYRKKFEMGKKLHLRDSNVDTFNVNNTVYKSFCRSLEIDGKDLVYEDRYKYLYPNNKVLCESNCIMNNTNFDLERILPCAHRS